MPVTTSAIQAGAGAIQAIGGYFQNRKATKELNNLQSPTYTPNQGISDYYNKALSRYSLNPYQSALYKMQQQNINRSTAQGISALQNNRMAIGGISNLIQGQNDSLLKAGATAENEQGQRLSQLGQAAGAKAGEDRMAFQINQEAPFERKYNLLAMKAGGGSQVENAGIQNVFGGLGSMNEYDQLKSIYGTAKSRNNNGSNGSGNSVGAGGPIQF